MWRFVRESPGNFVAGEQIAKVLVEPERITITGPKHHVEVVDAATTDPVDVSGTRTQATFTTNVYVSDPLVQVVQPLPVRVTVIMEKSVRRAGCWKWALIESPVFHSYEPDSYEPA
jgi:YbbR domain-containing protein